ncbi:hypothetical protein OG792_12995 [Micromonospora sp. NBC_01699]|uniref:hypothetical protein n=1 Tax=Micromonospora sp. NBC_01699 TaxID=2975984 RepID=UPI002E346D5C|nr:hypothetical protein [Micromonospora sp. NBC_01699]
MGRGLRRLLPVAGTVYLLGGRYGAEQGPAALDNHLDLIFGGPVRPLRTVPAG